MNDTPLPPDKWEVPVRHALTNKEVTLIVQASEGDVVLVPPPGPGVTVPRASLNTLRDALNVAEAVADLQQQTLHRIQAEGHGRER